jgi:hypothetical protein
MKPEIERVKNDLETIQKAMGTEPSFGSDWAKWIRRDNWLTLWWFLPGAILMSASFVRWDNSEKYWGLKPEQWIGALVCAVLVGMLVFWNRSVTRRNGRPDGLVREYKRINAASGWFLLPFLTQIALYFAWATQHGLTGITVMSGLWLVLASSVATLAVASRLWLYLGWALPMAAYAFVLPHVSRQWGGAALGALFVVSALLSWLITSVQVRFLEKQHDSH